MKTGKYVIIWKRDDFPKETFVDGVTNVSIKDNMLYLERGNIIYDYRLDVIMDHMWLTEFCGFCRGRCSNNHYVSPSTIGY